MNELALFAGAGGGILGGHLLGWRTVAAVEIEDYPRRVLLQRQADGCLPRFPIWDDVRTFDGKPWRGKVDVISAGFPCQDVSPARTNNNVNGKRAGVHGSKSGLWKEVPRLAQECGRPLVWVENSSHLRAKGLHVVLQDLDSLGYNTRRCVLGSGQLGADHKRDRMWILAYTDEAQLQRGRVSGRVSPQNSYARCANWRENQPRMERVAYGLADQMDRLAAIGNGQDGRVAALAWRILSGDQK